MYTRDFKPVRFSTFRFSGFVLLIIIWFEIIVAAQSPVVSVVVEPQETGEDFFVTFAHPFKKGDIKDTLLLKNGDEVISSQVNVKRRYTDGSVKHAIISTLISEAVRGRALTLDIYPGSEQPVVETALQEFPKGFSAKVVFQFPDGSERRANFAEFYRKASSGVKNFRMIKWLRGPLTSEVQLAGPPSGTDGKADTDLLVIFGLRAFKGGKSLRLEVVVESPWIDVGGNVQYDVMVFAGGKKMMAKSDVGYWNHRMPYWLKDKDRNLGHFAHARWRKVFWWGRELEKTAIRYNLSYLVDTGLVPPYDTTLKIDKNQIARSVGRWEQSPCEILENSIIMAYFPTTGGREDLGPYPTWTTRYLFSQDQQAWQMVLSTGNLAGSFPVHIRERTTGRIFSIDEHPGFSLNPRGTFERIKPRPSPDRPYLKLKTSPYEVDNAHQPSLAFIPYLFTGDYYYLEEMYFWANRCMLVQNAAYRQKDKGLITPDQVRGQAWALRQLVDAAKIAPDARSEKAYFDNKVRNNLQYYCDFIKGPDATPLGTYTLGASDAFVRGRSPEERRKWLTLAPWQQNFLVWSLDHAVRSGYSMAAGPRDYFAKLQIGMLTHPDAYNPDYATSYFLVIGERSGEEKRYYTSWDELFNKTFRVVAPDVKPGVASGDYGGSYSYIARATLIIGTRNKLPGADRALQVLESRLPQRDRTLLKDPTWAFKP